ncbi:MAG: hypothetical protein HFI86_05675 [Bacilli bacterium]|nr:hypothetical protein [Bacilli bacterium]
MRIFDYCKLRIAYNTLEVKYETVKNDNKCKDGIITRQKNEIKRLKEDLNNGNSRRKKRN